MNKENRQRRGSFLIPSIVMNKRLFFFTVIIIIAFVVVPIGVNVEVIHSPQNGHATNLGNFSSNVEANASNEIQTSNQSTVDIYILDRGNGHPNNNHIKQAFEAASCVAKHDEDIKVNITRGDFYSFEPFKYDIIVLQDYRASSGECELLCASDSETSALYAFVQSGKTAIALGCPCLKENAAFREIFGIYYEDVPPEDNSYTIVDKHPLTEDIENHFAISPKDVNPYGWAKIVVDKQSNSTVQVIVESESGEPAITVASHGEGTAIAFCFTSWTPLPTYNTPISEYTTYNKQIHFLANAIEWVAENQER